MSLTCLVPTFVLEGLNWSILWQVFLTVLPVWLFGAITGYLLPRPKESSSTWLIAPVFGPYLRKLTLAVHGVVIVRNVWKQYTSPGTFRALLSACYGWMCGRGFQLNLPRSQAGNYVTPSFVAPLDTASTIPDPDNWYISQKDLAFFQYHAEGSGQVAGASTWEKFMEKDIPNFVKYTAWRRTLPGNKTEYKTITICPDATSQEFMDFYLDDDYRPRWDGMIIHHEELEHGDFSSRQQVVRWIRRFPFKFLSDREYVIARRTYSLGDSLYALTKGIDHHAVPKQGKVVRCEEFHSMWRSRTVPCPWGSGRPACETLLLHQEQLKIPENLARFAARHGMWGFVKSLSEKVPEFIAERRKRASPTEADPWAYGSESANKDSSPVSRMDTSHSTLSLSSMTSLSNSDTSELGQYAEGCTAGKGTRRRRVRNFVAVAVATGVAIALHRSGSATSLPKTGHKSRQPKAHSCGQLRL